MSKNILILFCTGILMIFSPAISKSTVFTELSGEISERIIYTGTPYLVTSDIIIPAGITVAIDSGVVFLFQSFTGLQIQGTLLANGTINSPIIFSSENDRQYNPLATIDAAPYDWNGITIYENSLGSNFSWCAINFSLFGINALTDLVALQSCLFFQNGKSNFSIAGSKIDVGETYYSYTFSKQSAKARGVTLTIVDKQGINKTVWRYSGLSLIAIGGAIGTWRASEALSKRKEYLELAVDKFDGSNLTNKTKTNELIKGYYTDVGLSISGFVLMILGTIGFSVSFTL